MWASTLEYVWAWAYGSGCPPVEEAAEVPVVAPEAVQAVVQEVAAVAVLETHCR